MDIDIISPAFFRTLSTAVSDYCVFSWSITSDIDAWIINISRSPSFTILPNVINNNNIYFINISVPYSRQSRELGGGMVGIFSLASGISCFFSVSSPPLGSINNPLYISNSSSVTSLSSFGSRVKLRTALFFEFINLLKCSQPLALTWISTDLIYFTECMWFTLHYTLLKMMNRSCSETSSTPNLWNGGLDFQITSGTAVTLSFTWGDSWELC